jgi:two component regulator with propeller domain
MSVGCRSSAVLLLALSSVLPAHAVTVETWSAATGAELARGRLDGTALDARGRIRLAPTVRTIWGPDAGVVWALDAVAEDAAFLALSGPGRVLRVAAGKSPEVWFESADEELVTAIAAEPGGVVFGVAPGGRVLRARKPQASETKSELVIDTHAAFVWALARDGDGTLWVGTGAPGRLLRLRGSGPPEVVFETGDDPVRSIAPLPGGGVAFGTGARGQVLRLEKSGTPFALLDADETEIAALAVAKDGTIFALAAQRSKQPVAGRAPGESEGGEPGVARVTVSAQAPDEDEGEPQPPPPGPPRPQPRPGPVAPAGGALYRIDRNGDVRRLWQTNDSTPFDVLVPDTGPVLVSTGDKGRVYSIDREGRVAQLLRVSSDQASVLAAGRAGSVIVGGTTDARVEIVGPGPRPEGAYETVPIDAGTVATWGRLRWAAETPKGSRLEIETRAGNTAEPDATWSEWTATATTDGESGAETRAPAARWFQARFRLFAGRGEETPSVGRVEVSYQPRNRPPVLTALNVEAPGIVWVRGPSQASLPTGPVVADDPVARRQLSTVLPGRSSLGSIRKGYEPGTRTFSWRADDPDRDRLKYTLELRPEGEDATYVLAHDLVDEFFSWDARSVPDGIYRVSLIADDALDNANGTHRSTERDSDSFHVDNHRPGVGTPEIHKTDAGWEVRFEAEDPGGQIAAVEAAIDGGEWTPLAPDDGVADSPLERYRLDVPRELLPERSERTVLVRVVDAAGNVGGEMWRVGG